MSRAREPRPGRKFTVRLVIVLVVAWTAIALLGSSAVGAYYEAQAALILAPSLVLILAYCLTDRSRTTALVAVVATLIVLAAIVLAGVIPKGSAAFI